MVFALVSTPGGARAQSAGSANYVDGRISQLQQSIVELGRQIDRQQRQSQQLQQQLERMQAGYEQRLERLEKANAAKPAPARKRKRP